MYHKCTAGNNSGGGVSEYIPTFGIGTNMYGDATNIEKSYDGDESTYWYINSTAYGIYTLAKPIKLSVLKIYCAGYAGTGSFNMNVTVSGCNTVDGTYEQIGTNTIWINHISIGKRWAALANIITDKQYRYYRVDMSNIANIGISDIRFLG